jgi:uncharacterized protein YbgA (DUF1722 family)/uncharacterized protein YbbK (DUF523 family)
MVKIKIGVSQCLLGDEVRWNGGHTRDRFLTDVLGEYVEYVPVCPEVEIGLPIPREPLRLVGDPESPRLITQKTGIDMTEPMQSWARKRLDQLAQEDLCGYVFKTKSPSSGMHRVKVYNAKGVAQRNGIGMFARAFMERFPLMPVEDEGRLNGIELRENFIVRIFTYYRWKQIFKEGIDIGKIVSFHTRNKLLFMAHSPEKARQMGKHIAAAKSLPLEQFVVSYEQMMMDCLKLKATNRKNANVLYHMMGYFKKQLEKEDKQELAQLIENYRVGYVPLIAPITLINHYVRKYSQPYLQDQYYLNPHPIELKLRNHA